MAVAFVSTKNVKIPGASAASAVSAAWDISGTTNPVIIVEVTIISTTATVSSVAWSLGSGTPILVKAARGGSGNSSYSALWVIPAPTVGSGTVTVTPSTTIGFAASADLFSGADQTTPCPLADTASDITATQTLTLTAPNVGASDGAALCCCNTSVNITSVGNGGSLGTQTVLNSAGSVAIGGGYHLGNGDIQSVMSSATDAMSRVIARIAAAAVAVVLTPGAGSEPLTGRAPTIDWSVGMPNVP